MVVIEALVPMPKMCPKVPNALSIDSSAVYCTDVHVTGQQYILV